MSTSVTELSERVIALGDNFFDLIREIREGLLDEINIFAKLGVSALGLSERTPKPQVFGENIWKNGLVEAIPHFEVKALD
jgi:hypothetical protein